MRTFGLLPLLVAVGLVFGLFMSPAQATELEDHPGLHEDMPAGFTVDATGDGIPNWRDPESPYYVVLPLIQHAVNLAILVLILYVGGKGPIGEALRSRAFNVRKQITDAARFRDEARQRHEELTARLGSFEKELQAMREEAEREAKAERDGLIERANAASERFLASANRNIQDEIQRGRMALRSEAVQLAVELAEQTLQKQVEPDDQRRLAREFLETLQKDEVNGHG